MQLRPEHLDEVVGNKHVVECLRISLVSSIRQNKPLPHILLTGPSGTGKSTIAYVLANELGTKFLSANGSTVNDIPTILPYLARLQQHTIFFCDEIHSLKTKVQECLYTAMEDFFVDVSSKEQPIRMTLPPFTLIGATTESGKLTEPFYNRFVQQYTLEYYSVKELSQILKNNKGKIHLDITDDGITEIARRSKFTPRLANNYLDWVKNYAVAHSIEKVNAEHVCHAFKLRKIDERGLTNEDKQYLEVLQNNSPCGIETLESLTGLSSVTLSNNIEPLLMRMGLVRKTSKGRVYCE